MCRMTLFLSASRSCSRVVEGTAAFKSPSRYSSGLCPRLGVRQIKDFELGDVCQEQGFDRGAVMPLEIVHAEEAPACGVFDPPYRELNEDRAGGPSRGSLSSALCGAWSPWRSCWS